jgi:glycosyltransferase involved in cell wall biosynthesis
VAAKVEQPAPGTAEAARLYAEVVARFTRRVRRALPPGATVAVVSKGDAELLRIAGRRACHFPQRSDGVYAGYYPPDGASAIEHVEAVREHGAEFLAFPTPALWWLEHYPELTEHLDSRYRLLIDDAETCVIYALVEPGTRRAPPREIAPVADAPLERPAATARVIDEPAPEPAELVGAERVDDVRALFDATHYGRQAGIAFASADDALRHYLSTGYERGLDPHPLFDAGWYVARHPEVRLALANPLVHFVAHSVSEGQDPSPYFDTEFYYAQGPSLRDNRVNALRHYLENSPRDRSYRPNPLFGDGFYLTAYPDVRSEGLAPLVHYLQFGCDEGRFVSQVHQSMARHLRRSVSLTRGNWRVGTVLVFAGAQSTRGVAALAARLARDYRLDCVVVARDRSAVAGPEPRSAVLVLDDFRMACDVFRPSAQRLLARTLTPLKPLFAVTEVPEAIEGLTIAGIGTYLAPAEGALDSPALAQAFNEAKRVLLPSSAAFHAAAARLGRYPANVALWRRDAEADEVSARALVDLARRDFDLGAVIDTARGRLDRDGTRKILIPCSDWNVSGVNASLEALGTQLIGLGWDVEIVFTRDEASVRESAGDEAHLPRIPYRFLHRRVRGVEGMWEALIADVETNAPCVMFTGYDFLANSVVPALSEKVGVVAWLQADDGDYYEQTYRLGRYCNAVVCVSECIRDTVRELHPRIGERAHVIHNSSVRNDEVAAKRGPRSKTLRLVYAGRLVQYQKRVLDFVTLARALDRTGIRYELSLIGTFSAHEDARDAFERDARAHLEDGRIKLPGRMGRDALLAVLDDQDLFILLSDFEGFPLALVEAMARGCVPVVAESRSGIPELLKHEDDGLVMGGRDYDEWARLISELWADRRRLARMSQRTRSNVRGRFTVERAAREFDRLFTQVAGEVAAGAFERPGSLHPGGERATTGDVLPPPSLLRPAAVRIAGLR